MRPTVDSELDTLRVTCWRQAHELYAMRDTVAILRAGAARLATENAILQAELALARSAAPIAGLRLLTDDRTGRVTSARPRTRRRR